ncbi:hypothetical protein DPMN_070346 [Dreissena polymorpha]|uniref:Uncharacterized protein n=1 Tax=Dreissena polymorpha TaxID=45954 RepID=A0A9D4BNU5_DREPO|nr:hypothetical protein DPMN_070346 [Dreissena polymorpha]
MIGSTTTTTTVLTASQGVVIMTSTATTGQTLVPQGTPTLTRCEPARVPQGPCQKGDRKCLSILQSCMTIPVPATRITMVTNTTVTDGTRMYRRGSKQLRTLYHSVKPQRSS